MHERKIISILGARPQFIKASVVSAALAASSLREVVVHTGQHFDSNMSGVFFEELGMRPPDYCCNINGGSHGAMTARMLHDIEEILLAERPEAVLVYGDTNSTLAGALAAAKLTIPVAHVEAGLRSANMAMPEEINRILTDRVSRWLFAPTDGAAAHLAREGVAPDHVLVVGDVMLDVALRHGSKCNTQAGMLGELARQRRIAPHTYCLATIHRAESTAEPLRMQAIVDALVAFGQAIPVIFPLHPRTRHTLSRLGQLDRLAAAVHVIDPLGYRDMVQLEKYAALIATDSGGVQKEAFFHRVPCVTLREETEWPELLSAGWNRLVAPTSSRAIVLALRNAMGTSGQDIAPYGDGNAAQRIVTCLENAIAGPSDVAPRLSHRMQEAGRAPVP